MLRRSRALLVASYLAIGVLAFVYRHDIAAWGEQVAHASGPSTWIAFAALMAVAVAVALPMSPLFLLCGYAFGLPGIAVSLIAVYAGSCLSFAITRHARFSPRSEVVSMLRQHGPRFIGWLRLSPIVPVAAINIGAGVLGVSWRHFLRTLPPSGVTAVLLTALGSFGSSFARGEVDASAVAVLVLAIASGIGVVVAAVRTKRRIDEGGPHVAPPIARSAETIQPERTVGVEMEIVALDVDEAAAVVADVLGGSVGDGHSSLERVVDTPLGEFRIERDSKPLKDAADVGEHDRNVIDKALLLARPIVPLEVVSPPLPISRIGVMDEIAEALREAGARGTSRSIFDALGVHLNPEATDMSAQGIRDTLRAFFLLRRWLRDEMDIDLSRRVSPWIGGHSDTLVQRVLDPSYAPTLDALIDDYLEHDPSRNRDLDLFPLFAHLRPERMAELDDDRIKARPTYHYRLPNCALDDPTWSVMQEWQRWKLVERLAADAPRLRRWMEAWNEADGAWDAPVVGRVA